MCGIISYFMRETGMKTLLVHMGYLLVVFIHRYLCLKVILIHHKVATISIVVPGELFMESTINLQLIQQE